MILNYKSIADLILQKYPGALVFVPGQAALHSGELVITYQDHWFIAFYDAPVTAWGIIMGIAVIGNGHLTGYQHVKEYQVNGIHQSQQYEICFEDKQGHGMVVTWSVKELVADIESEIGHLQARTIVSVIRE